MKQFIYDLLSEKSTISTMRFMCLMSMACAIFLAIYGVVNAKDVNALVDLFVIAAFGGKIAHKVAE